MADREASIVRWHWPVVLPLEIVTLNVLYC
jgi:hypothetical protein